MAACPPVCRRRPRRAAVYGTSARAQQRRRDDGGRGHSRPATCCGACRSARGRTSSSRPTDGKYTFASNYGTGPAPGHTISMIDLGRAQGTAAHRRRAARRPHGLRVRRRQTVFHGGSQQDDRALRSGDRQDRLALRDGPERHAHGARVEGPEKDLHVEHRIRQHVHHRSRRLAARGIRRSCRSARVPRRSSCRRTAKRSGRAHSRDGGVSVIDVASKKVVATIDAKTKRSNRLKLTPDGKFVLISDDVGRR